MLLDNNFKEYLTPVCFFFKNSLTNPFNNILFLTIKININEILKQNKIYLLNN